MNFSGPSLVRTLALRLCALAAVALVANPFAAPALALGEDTLVAKLDVIPTFTIVDSEGKPLLLVPKANKDTAIFNFYLDASLAKQAMQAVVKQNPNKNKSFRIMGTGLGRAYKIVKEQRAKKDNKVQFQFLSSPKSVQYAQQVAQKKDANFKSFQGVPVFFVSGGERKGILTLKREGQEYLPMFFSEVDLQRNLAELKKSRTDLPKNLTVEVATLDSVVGTILGGQNDNDAQKITFIPAKTSLDYAKAIQGGKNK